MTLSLSGAHPCLDAAGGSSESQGSGRSTHWWVKGVEGGGGGWRGVCCAVGEGRGLCGVSAEGVSAPWARQAMQEAAGV